MKAIEIFLIASVFISTSTEGQQVNAISSGSANIKKSTEGKKVFINGFGATDAVNLNSVTANGGLSFGIRPDSKNSINVSIGVGGNLQKRENQDSVNINSIFFPDNATSVVYINFERALLLTHDNNGKPDNRSQLLGYLEGSLQNRNLEKDTIIHNFMVSNYSVGLKYQWKYTKDDNSFTWIVGAGYGYIEIAKQHSQSFESLFDTTINSAPRIIRGINFLTSAQYNDIILYARVFKPSNDPNHLKDIYFSTGIKVSGLFFGF